MYLAEGGPCDQAAYAIGAPVHLKGLREVMLYREHGSARRRGRDVPLRLRSIMPASLARMPASGMNMTMATSNPSRCATSPSPSQMGVSNLFDDWKHWQVTALRIAFRR